MSDTSRGQDSTFLDWKTAFYEYIKSRNLSELFSSIENELNLIGWPSDEDISLFSPQQQRDDISSCSANLIRLQKVLYDLRAHQVKLESYYKYMYFLRTQEGDTLKGNTKEEKKVYAELELYSEKNLIKNIELFIERIENLNQAYKSRYNAISRIHSIVTFELEMSK